MCGVVGIVSLTGGPVDLSILQRMNNLQSHRGPDGEGFVLGRTHNSPTFEYSFVRHTEQAQPGPPVCVGLGHRRLAILDLSDRGLQPMASSDNNTWIVFNGEIYNYLELKSELKAHGYLFTTRTDTEVLLRAYLQWGEDCLPRLEGMYAFAVWDGPRGRLFCARDRLGIKPFYYATPNGYFIFASEIKSLLAFPGLEAAPAAAAVLGFLVHGNCDYDETTILSNVKALPAAHCLTLDVNTRRISPRRYWQITPQPNGAATHEEQIAGLKDLLLATVRKHLNSDVRVGSCLSGGLDSSTVVSLAGKIWREQPEAARALGANFYTFTSCYEQRELDERDYALAVSSSVEVTPQLVFPSPSDFWSDFERMAWHEDMPFGGLSYYAQWSVMRAAKEAGVKVLLDGQGGDEVFGGYAKFRYAYLISLLRAGRLAKMVRELGATLRQGDRYVLDIRKGFRYLPKSVRSLLSVDSLLKDVLRADWGRAVSAEATPATRWWRNTSAAGNGDGPWTIMQRIQIDDLLLDTLPTLLRLEDRSSMAFSLEARVPLLDHKLVEYGISLPDDLKVRNGWSKYALRQAMRGLLPESVRLRKSKLGFAAPDHSWLSRELRPHVTELIEDDLRCREYVDPAVLRRWYNSGRVDAANTESCLGLFRILSLEMWMRAFHLN